MRSPLLHCLLALLGPAALRNYGAPRAAATASLTPESMRPTRYALSSFSRAVYSAGARPTRRSAAPASRCRVEGGSGCGDDYVTGRRCSPRRLRIAHEALLEIVRVLDDVPRAGDPVPHLVGESCLPGLRAQREKVPVARRGPGLGVSRVLHSPYWRRRAPNLTPPTRGSSRRAPAGAPSAWRSRARSSATP